MSEAARHELQSESEWSAVFCRRFMWRSVTIGVRTPPQVKCRCALARSGYAQYPPHIAVAPFLAGLSVEEIRGKIRRLEIKPAFLRRLGSYVTKEELESIYQTNESLTRIFEKMLFFCVFKKK